MNICNFRTKFSQVLMLNFQKYSFIVSDNDFVLSEHSITCVPMVCKVPPLLELSARAIVNSNSSDNLDDLPVSLQGTISFVTEIFFSSPELKTGVSFSDKIACCPSDCKIFKFSSSSPAPLG